MRERGLKLVSLHEHNHLYVAPHAGAWVETVIKPMNLAILLVAPHAGAWVETKI